MEDIILIEPGHYCTRDSFNADNKQIIRVLGPAEKEGYWITSDGKVLSDYIISEDYVRLDTSYNQNSTNNPKRNFLAGFKPTISPNDGPLIVEENIPTVSQPIQSPSVATHTTPQPVQVQTTDKFSDIRFLLEKASIESLNKSSQKKYGVSNYQPTKIQIPIDIEIPYELNKLNQICELFELDPLKIAQMVYETIQLPEQMIISEILNRLSLKPDEVKSQPIKTESKPTVIPTEEQIELEPIEEKIETSKIGFNFFDDIE